MAELKLKQKDVKGGVGGPPDGSSFGPEHGGFFEREVPITPVAFDRRALLELPRRRTANMVVTQQREQRTIALGSAFGRSTWLALDGGIKGTDGRGEPLLPADALYVAATALSESAAPIEHLTNGLMRKIVAQTAAKIDAALKKRPSTEAQRALAGGLSLLLILGLAHRDRSPELFEHTLDVVLRSLARARPPELARHYLAFLGGQGELLSDGQFRCLRELVNEHGFVESTPWGEPHVPFPGAWAISQRGT